jgi:AraC-like DNA-binding protein
MAGMKPVPLARASVLDPLFGYLARTGVSCAGEITRARARLLDPLSLVPLAIGGRLWENATRLTGLQDLGLRVGAVSRPEDVGALGAFVRRAPTVGAAIERAVREGSRFNSGERYWVTREDDQVVLHQSFSRALREGRRQASEFVLMLWIRLIRMGAGEAWRPTEIGLEGATPAYAPALAGLARERVRFAQPETTLTFPRTLLALRLPPLARGTPTAHDLSTAPSEAWPSADFADSVRQTIAALLQLGSADVAAVAHAAGTSVRSLQRGLADASFSFSRLLEEARSDAAQRLLRDPGRKVIAVSAELGYSDSANFTRAFRRWTGLSPRAFRRSATGVGAGLVERGA